MNPSLLRSKRLRMSSEAASVRPLPPPRSLSLFRDAAAGRPKATLQTTTTTTTTHTHNDVGRQGGDGGPSLETPPSYLSYKIKFTRVVSGVRMERTDQPTQNPQPTIARSFPSRLAASADPQQTITATAEGDIVILFPTPQ